MVPLLAMTERPPRHSIEEWLALPEDVHVELIDGEYVKRASPAWNHGTTQFHLGSLLGPEFNRPAGSSKPGGWWIAPEVDIVLNGDGFRPDMAGWRRSRVPEMPKDWPTRLTPDWIAEVVSPGNRTHDTVTKLQRYHAAGVAHYWLLDPEQGSLHVYRHQPDGYLLVLAAQRPMRVHAEPCEAVEYAVGELLGDDPQD